MRYSMFVIGTTFVFALLTSIVYFIKAKISNTETRIYRYLSILSVINCIFEMTLCVNILLKIPLFGIYNLIINRLFLIFLFSWFTLFTYYIIIIAFQNNDIFVDSLKDKFGENHKRVFTTIFSIYYIFNIFLLIILPIDLVDSNGSAYSAGFVVNYLIGLLIAYVVLWFSIIGYNRKYVEFKKTIPCLFSVFSFALILAARILYPTLLLNSFSVSFLTIIMFFTIENPDLRMVEEMSKIQNINEKTNEEKSHFIYLVTEEVNEVFDDISDKLGKINKSTSKSEMNDYIDNIRVIVSNGKNKLHNTIDVSEVDSKNLQIVGNYYNIENLINSIYLINKKNVKNDVDFRLSIVSNLPTELYGDQIKIKQIVTTVLDNSIKYTERGFIELRINSIIKNDVCRLIISVEDSGTGIDLLKQSEILSNHDDLNDDDIEISNDLNLNLKMIRKIISLIGGTFTIDSKDNKGTRVQIVIDQKIVAEKKSKESISVENYSDAKKMVKEVAVITRSNDTSRVIKNVCKYRNCDVKNFEVTKDCLDIIRSGYKYNLIFIDENMDKIDARSFIYKLKREGFKIPVIVITNADYYTNKKDLMDKGFSSVINEPLDKNDIKKIIESL